MNTTQYQTQSIFEARQKSREFAREGYIAQIITEADGSFTVVAQPTTTTNVWAEPTAVTK
jgi:hypothetical protein